MDEKKESGRRMAFPLGPSTFESTQKKSCLIIMEFIGQITRAMFAVIFF